MGPEIKTKPMQKIGHVTMTQETISSELDALARGDLRMEQEVKALFDLLIDASPEQLARAEELHVGLLARGGPLTRLPLFGIVVESRPDGLKNISYYEINKPERAMTTEDLNPTSKNGILFNGELQMRLLGTVHDARLVTPTISSLDSWSNRANAERVITLNATGSRLTYHRGIPLTWDVLRDEAAWSTNIDTVFGTDWLREISAFNPSVRSAAIVGCGAGGDTQAVLQGCSHLEKLVFTDINAHAINATLRNIAPYRGKTDVTWAIGKGLRNLAPRGSLDLIHSNPPYLPRRDGAGDIDHYSGTKLIKRLFEDGIPLLNPDNPDAAIFVQMSSVTLPDFHEYCSEHPEVEVTQVAGPVKVPLRILGVLQEPGMLDFLMKQGGLEYRPNDPLEYYHEILAFKLQPMRR